MAVAAAQEDGDVHHLEPNAADEPGLRAWIRDLPQADGISAAAFDTRADKSPRLTGAASHGIAKRLRRRGYHVLATASFVVEGSEGPLADGELERARAWASKLAAEMQAPAGG